MQPAIQPNKTNIIYGFLPKELEGKQLIDFLHNINPRTNKDMEILAHWRTQFIKRNTPFILTEVSPVLWKMWTEERGTER